MTAHAREAANEEKLQHLEAVHAELVDLFAEMECEVERLRAALARAGVIHDA